MFRWTIRMVPLALLALATSGCEALLASAPSDGGEPDSAAAPDASQIACTGPSDCASGSAHLCCAQLTLGSGAAPNCPVVAASSSCVSTCAETLSFCPGSETLRMCSTGADCDGDAGPNTVCCPMTNGVLQGSACVPANVALGMGCAN